MTVRKIVHVDMDAFYASVEQRDRPELRGRPVVVAWKGPRSVVCAASYEARRFGVRSAMPATRAERLCPQAIFVPPDFPRYREVSRAVRAIFLRHTPLVEPLSLDEAYLDVTRELTGLPTATATAREIRRAIREETSLTASAGVAPNKFLAKIASDWRKPDGLFVIQPHEVEAFLTPLPVGKLPGVGRSTGEALAALGIATVGDLRARPLVELEQRFGKFGRRLHELALGRDESAVRPDRPVRSVSSETTFDNDLPLAALPETLTRLAHRVWEATRRRAREGRTVTLKLKTADFRTLTRRITPPHPPVSADELAGHALALLEAFSASGESGGLRFRLAGVGVSNFPDEEEGGEVQAALFENPT
ncbi:MAG: DNA polymerase IV [Thermoanaerobaculia bacterium]